jgi:hypothetical protein
MKHTEELSEDSSSLAVWRGLRWVMPAADLPLCVVVSSLFTCRQVEYKEEGRERAEEEFVQSKKTS